MNKVFMMYSTGIGTLQLENPRWNYMSERVVNVYFHPNEEAHAFVGDMLIKGSSINFIPFTEATELPDERAVFFMVPKEPEGQWIHGKRWAIPAKEHEIV